MARCGPFVRQGKPWVWRDGKGWTATVGTTCQKCGDCDIWRIVEEVSWGDALAAAVNPPADSGNLS